MSALRERLRSIGGVIPSVPGAINPLRAGRSGVLNLLVGARDFFFSTPVHTDPGSHPVSSTLGIGALSLGVKLSLTMSRAIPLFLLCASTVCFWVTFIFTDIYSVIGIETRLRSLQ